MSSTKLNALTLYVHFVVVALIGLVANPLLVRSLGAEHFGIWKACLRILDLSAVADGRGTQALKWIVAHGDSRDDADQKRRDIGAALAIWMIWLPILLVVVSASVAALPYLITGIDAADLQTVRLAAGLLGLNVVLMGLLTLPDAVLVGTNQGYRSYVVTTLFLVLSNIGMVLAAHAGFGLVGLGVVTVAAQVVNGLIVLVIARRFVRWWGVRRPRWADVRRVLGFSNLTLVWALVQLVLLSSEVLLIGYFSGPVDVSRYTFTAYVAQFALSICLMTGSAVTPRLGALCGAGKLDEATVLHARTRRILYAIITVVASGIILMNGAFVSLWVGPDFYMGDAANLAMVALMIQLALIRFDAQVQDVGLQIGRKVLWGSLGATVSLITAGAVYTATSDVALMFVGLLAGRLPLSFIFPRQVDRLIPGTGTDWRGLAGMTAILLATAGLAALWQPQGFAEFVLAGLIGPGLAALGAAFVILKPADRAFSSTIMLRWKGSAA